MMRGLWIAVGILAAAAIAAAGVFVVRHDWAVEDVMAAVHAGPTSPYARLNAQGTAAVPDWAALELVVAPLDEMARTLLAAKNPIIRESSSGYVGAVGDLRSAIAARDLPALQAASQALRRSCADCHSPGGVGGDLPGR